MAKVIEIVIYLIGISFITYWYKLNDVANSDWYSVGIILIAIYGVSCFARQVKRLIDSREEHGN